MPSKRLSERELDLVFADSDLWYGAEDKLRAHIASLEASEKRLREALSIYDNETFWDDPDDDRPWEFARAALQTEEREG